MRDGARAAAARVGGGGADIARGGVPDAAALRDAGVDALFRDPYAGLLRLAYCLLGDRARAEDVVQDAFISIYSHWDGLREAGSALAYLRAAVIYGSRSRLRQRFREVTRGDLVVVETEQRSSEDEALAAEENERLAAAVRTLPRRQREVMVCRYYLELSVAETAGLLRNAVTDRAFIYDPPSNAWSEAAPLPAPRSSCTRTPVFCFGTAAS